MRIIFAHGLAITNCVGDELMSDTEQKNFGQLLAYHTAPTLLGIKCASLVSLPRTEYDVDAQSCYFNRRTAAKGLNSRVLCGCGGRVLLLVYNEAMAKAIAEGGERSCSA